MPGPIITCDIVEVLVFRLGAPDGIAGDAAAEIPPAKAASPVGSRAAAAEFLQLRRAGGKLAGSWQPVMGHVEPGETAIAAAVRELREETGFVHAARADVHGNKTIAGFWQLETPDCFFLAAEDRIMVSPCFAVRVAHDAEPALDSSHDAFRWVRRDHVDRDFLWPGQRHAIEQIVRDLLPAGSLVEPFLRIDVGQTGPA